MLVMLNPSDGNASAVVPVLVIVILPPTPQPSGR
jgi:hypothetical protein